MALTQVTKEFIVNIDPNQINSGGATTKDVLNWDGSKWAPNSLASINNGNFIPTPGASLTGQVLTFDGTSWVGQGLPSNGVSSSDFTGSNQSLATNGYQKLPGGLIMQWGSATSSTDTFFPLPFPNSVFSMVATPANSGPCFTHIIKLVTTSFNVTIRTTNNNFLPGTPFFWQAIGN